LRRLGETRAAEIVEALDERSGPPSDDAAPPPPLAHLLRSDPKTAVTSLRAAGQVIPFAELRTLGQAELAALQAVNGGDALVEASLAAVRR